MIVSYALSSTNELAFFPVYIIMVKKVRAFIAGYDIEEQNLFPTKPDVNTVPPAVAAGVGNYSSPALTKETRISAQISTESEFHSCLSSLLTSFRFFIILLFLL